MRTLKFDDMSFSRTSGAWCPITGKQVGVNTPRVVENLILEHIGEPTIYYSFDASQGYTQYSNEVGCYTRSGETTGVFTDMLDVFELIDTSLERLSLGLSYEGRPIEAFRLGPASRQHFVISSIIHGNEAEGIPGTFKAMEFLITHPDFAQLRNDYTILWFPCSNPDGYYRDTRNLAKLGPNPSGVDATINLNRVWPWFWTEYTPTANESKGETPLDCTEALALYTYITTGNAGNPVPIRFMLDMHSTAGDGARYQSRDRNFKNYDEYSWFDVWADWIIYRHLKGIQAKRVHEEAMPDLFVNYFRSVFNPHFHPWIQTRSKADNGGVAAISMVCEFNKVYAIDAYTDKETYQSACNYNMDYVLSCALVMQGGIVVPRDAVLIEHEVGSNQVQNSEFVDWQKRSTSGDPIDYRPGFWTPSREIIGQIDRSERHMDYQGKAISLEPDLIVEVPSGQNVGPNNYHDFQKSLDGDSQAILITNVDSGGIACLEWDQNKTTGVLTQLFVDAASPSGHQIRLAGGQLAKVVTIDLGDAGHNMTVNSYTASAYTRTVETTYTNCRKDAAVAFNGSSTSYVIGGEDSIGSLVRTVLSVNRSTYAVTELGTNLLTTADSCAEAIYCSGGTLDTKVVVIGGRTVDAGGLRIVIITPSGPTASETILSVAGTTLPNDLCHCALSYDGVDTIWIYGGEDYSTNILYNKVWTLKYVGSAWTITEESLLAGLSDDSDPEDYGGTSYWVDFWARWRSVRLLASDTGLEMVALLGGVQMDPDTSTLLPGPYTSLFIHSIDDEVMSRSQNYTYGYYRYNYAMSTLGAYTKANVSWSVKADSTTETGYTRITNSTGDSVGSITTVRRNRTYYTHAPRWWFRHSGALDLSSGRPDKNEDEWRLYMRAYRDGEIIFTDAPMVQTDTCWPSSWSPYGFTRQAEVSAWFTPLDPRWMKLKLVWLPAASFLCLSADTQLAVITDGTLNLELWALVGTNYERTYYRDQVYGPADPLLELRAYESDGVTYTSCSIPVYWGGYIKDISRDRFDSPLTIEIWQHPRYGRGFSVKNGSVTGTNVIPGKFDPTTWGSSAPLFLMGGGWWAEPEVDTIKKSWAMQQYLNPNPTGALLVGDRDPTFGKVDSTGAFRYIETFDRSDSSNLGSFWDVIQQTGNGWNILGNKAVCQEIGWERWDAQPNLRDCSIIGSVKINNNTCRVGFFYRLSWSMASEGFAHGYLGSLYADGSGTATVVIESLTYDGTQHRSTLTSAACSYVVGNIAVLTFDVVGSTLTLTAKTVGGSTLGTCTTTDTTHPKPEAFGICGETPNSSSTVEIHDVTALPLGGFKIRITE